MYAELFPYEYCNEAMDIANANNRADWAVGLDMFINNVQDAYAQDTDMYHYPGADDLDYKALNAIFVTMTEAEIVNRKYIYRTVYNKKAKGVYARLRRAGETKALRALFLSDIVASGMLSSNDQKAMEAAIEKAGYNVQLYSNVIKTAENAK